MNNEEKILAILESMDARLSSLESMEARLASLESMEARLASLESKIDNIPTRTEMLEGFDELKELVNISAKDAARTERLLIEHVAQPVH